MLLEWCENLVGQPGDVQNMVISLLPAGHPPSSDATRYVLSLLDCHGARQMHFLSAGSLDAHYEALSLYLFRPPSGFNI